MSKQKIIYLVIFVLLLPLFITWCWKKENSLAEKGKKQEILLNEYEKITKKIKENKVSLLRENISLDDISLMRVWSYTGTTNELENLGSIFISHLQNSSDDKLTDNKDWGISIETLNKELEKVPEKYKRNFNLELDIYDSASKEKVASGSVYLNGVNLWKFEKWKVKTSFHWLKWIEKFDILVRSEKYWDAMIGLNSINSEWELLLWEIFMKKAIVENKEIGKVQELKFSWVSLKLDECSLVIKSWECYNGKTQVKVNFISWKEANEWIISINRKALTKEWTIVGLQSGGMAFFDFIAPNWEILKLKEWKTIEIAYNINDEDIKNMEMEKYGNGEKNGYWWYDKNTALWREETAKITLDTKNKLWKAEVSHLY
jgi:hypothetical protein